MSRNSFFLGQTERGTTSETRAWKWNRHAASVIVAVLCRLAVLLHTKAHKIPRRRSKNAQYREQERRDLLELYSSTSCSGCNRVVGARGAGVLLLVVVVVVELAVENGKQVSQLRSAWLSPFTICNSTDRNSDFAYSSKAAQRGEGSSQSTD